jgi:hypothetical protein
MNLDKYPVVARNDHMSYEFYSEGPKGLIRKIILYKKLDWDKNVFSLGFGDWDEKTQNVNDKVNSNNNDRDKILATVAATVLDFAKRHPGAIVYARGATPSRTRLYQMGIRAHWIEINMQFDIRGYRQGKWETFRLGNNYEAFTVRIKE